MGRPQGRFLVVEDDVLTARALGRSLRRFGLAMTAGTCQEATALLDARLTGLILDMGLPDGEGLEVLTAARAICPTLPALILTGSEDPQFSHEAFAQGVGYLRKPATIEELHAFAREAIAHADRLAIPGPIGLEVWRARYGLTQREAEILRAAVDGADHARLAALFGVTVGTIGNQVHRLLTKVGASSLLDAVRRLLLTVPER